MKKFRSFFWNMLGSGIYSLATVIFVMLAKRLVGEEAGAEFYMAFTTGQMLLTIGYFEIRPFQVTDVGRQYEPKEYFGFRGITSLIMIICAVAVAAIYFVNKKADMAGSALIIILCLFKMFDGVADVFEGEFQRNDRIDLSGKSMAFRTVASMVVFTVCAFYTKNIYLASVLTAVTGLVGAVAVAVVWHTGFERLGISVEKEKMLNMFRSTFLLFVSSAMCMWIWNGTKYVVQWNLDATDTLVYGIVYMPTMVINLASSFVFKPMLTTLAGYYKKRDMKAFGKLLWVLAALVVLITLVTFIGGALLGIPVLSWLYAIDLSAYKWVMLVLIMAGGFNALSIVFYYGLMVMRMQKEIFAGYGITFVLSIILPVIFIKRMGILSGLSSPLMGAALSYLMVMLILTVIFGLMLFWAAGKINYPHKKGGG